MVAGDKRRSIKNVTLQSINFYHNLCNKALTYNSRDACLMALLYLSARRIGEVLELKKRDIVIQDNYFRFKTFNEKTFRKMKRGNYRLYRQKRFYEEIEIEIEFKKSNTGKLLSPFIFNHLNTLAEEDYIFHWILTKDNHIGRCMAYKIVTFYDPSIWLHLFRHARTTQITEAFKDNPLKAQQFLHHKHFENTLAYYHAIQDRKDLEKI